MERYAIWKAQCQEMVQKLEEALEILPEGKGSNNPEIESHMSESATWSPKPNESLRTFIAIWAGFWRSMGELLASCCFSFEHLSHGLQVPLLLNLILTVRSERDVISYGVNVQDAPEESIHSEQRWQPSGLLAHIPGGAV